MRSIQQNTAGRIRRWLAVPFVAALVALADAAETPATANKEAAPEGMVWIAGGTFAMGSELPGGRMDEKPVIKVTLDGFWIDACDVTNAQFRKFADATGYKTIAERPIDWEEMKSQVPPGTPKPSDEDLQPGGVTFAPQPGAIQPGAEENWWTWTHGANWQHPEGPASDIKSRDNHPVVLIAWEDAVAYAKWAGKRLPTEAEWEFAARGGLDGRRFAWGDEFKPGGKFMANTWTGTFSNKNTEEDGFPGTSPVKSFPANGYGLYDMGGNVWNWCADWYRVDTFARAKLAGECINPVGPNSSYSPGHPLQQERVIKGGSYLCNVDYSEGYRPGARRGSPIDTGMSHIGFRCAKGVPKAK
ncbi:MAG: formylglycine-generating enzyme family protein [Luteolibacter sp.]|uniref:formylglycine-generating enzyme family protein n=1 Tax=Luteolibacter sp. TaxID=1962973 RepID=UPI0032641630